MQSRQITIGFDRAVNVAKIVRILRTHFDDVEVGEGIAINGLSENTVYVHNNERKTRVLKQR
jgi:hypothetical protein